MAIARYNLYAGASLDSIDEAAAVATVNRPATQITVSHPLSTRRCYLLKAENDDGESGPSNVVQAAVDGSGDLSGPMPPAPIGLSATPIAGGSIRLRWTTPPAKADEADVSVANVYHDNGTGTIDYATPIASVSFPTGYYDAGPYAHGTLVQFAVRNQTAAGDEEANGETATALADSIAPPLASEFTAEVDDG